MLEVKYRSGPARIARWSDGQVRFDTPIVLWGESYPFMQGRSDLVFDHASESHRAVHQQSGEQVFSVPETLYTPLSALRWAGDLLPVVGDNSFVTSADGRAPPEDEVKGKEVAVLGNAFELRRDARAFVSSIVSLRRTAGNKRLIYLPGMMDASNLALLVYMGADIFDDTLISYLASIDKITTTEGPLSASESEWLFDGPEKNVLHISAMNVWKELQLVKHMIKKERLRELVETRVHSSPWMVAALRIFDEDHYEFQETRYPLVGPRFYANAKQSLFRPDVWRYRKRIIERYTRPETKKVLLLLPCSAKKPYSTSKSHQTFRRVIQSVSNFDVVHEVIVTSPLGVVPRELELFYPAAQYDIPVTGHWDREEVAMVQELVGHIASQGYEKVICHLGDEGDIVREVIDCIDTSHGLPGSKESLNRLREVLAEECAKHPRPPMGEDRQRTMAAVARFQFGKNAGALVEGCRVSGSYPYSRIQEGQRQMGMLTPERGMISLTIEGAERIAGKGLGLVRVGDFEIEGNLFAKGIIEADPGIRIGDEVAVIRSEKVVGVGVAMMFGEEMTDSDRGEAVRMRHYIKRPK
ncbi:MAG: DUF5591 domain-containing protein [Methanomassiliicoccales archaeon]|nr:MAG: DUF5591 domain-containing protein [Methanomassiliicoccales archaeon]